ncbi:MAG: hypothetical protein ACPGN5_04695, partial [Porticoccaceae bacterium]
SAYTYLKLIEGRQLLFALFADHLVLVVLPATQLAVLESAVLAMALPKVTQLLVRSSKKLSQFTAEIKGMVLGFAPVTVASRDAGPELTRTYSQRVTGADPRTMLPPLPTHTKPKQDSSHA